MNYELAKKLKDAGFPQKGLSPWPLVDLEKYDQADLDLDVWSPPLSELIEACGDKFVKLGQSQGFWVAEGIIGNTYQSIADAKNPEEAVANLWLELNK